MAAERGSPEAAPHRSGSGPRTRGAPRAGADLFAEWLASEGLHDIDIAEDDARDDLDWRVTYTHQLCPALEAINGWETSVEAE